MVRCRHCNQRSPSALVLCSSCGRELEAAARSNRLIPTLSILLILSAGTIFAARRDGGALYTRTLQRIDMVLVSLDSFGRQMDPDQAVVDTDAADKSEEENGNIQQSSNVGSSQAGGTLPILEATGNPQSIAQATVAATPTVDTNPTVTATLTPTATPTPTATLTATESVTTEVTHTAPTSPEATVQLTAELTTTPENSKRGVAMLGPVQPNRMRTVTRRLFSYRHQPRPATNQRSSPDNQPGRLHLCLRVHRG